MDITCTAFGKRMEVLRDFSPHFLTRHSITRGSTEKDRTPENSPFLINSRDKETIAQKAATCTALSHFYPFVANYHKLRIVLRFSQYNYSSPKKLKM